MPQQPPAHTNRRGAEAFGVAADEFDRYRPRYLRALVTDLIPGDGVRTLDVGAGTGIESAQLVEAGAQVLAVEPDPRMARVAASKGIRVEQATFEDWQPASRTFDLVVFAQSFHCGAAECTEQGRDTLEPGWSPALLSNPVTHISPELLHPSRECCG